MSEKQEIFTHLAEVFECNAFEICKGREKGEYLIPYMMNDALEYYFVLKGCKMTGEYLSEEEIDSVQIEREKERYVLVIRQESGNTFTLLFQEIQEQARCYQYHRIGHFWVKGQEPWRRLVYMIGTIYDKYEFFGERFCSKKEQEIMYLICFAPFRMWSPVSSSLETRYPDDKRGLEMMEKLAAEAEDKEYQRLLKIYRCLPFSWMARCLGHQLTSDKRQKLYELILGKIEKASCEYPKRDYGTELNREIENKRRKVHEFLKEKGYEGTYPRYQKGSSQILATEELPFTIMEWDDFVFRIQLMETEGKETLIREYMGEDQ